MHYPFVALIWECWRLSRRWYLWVLPLALVIDLTLMSRAGTLAANGPAGGNVAVAQALTAPAVLMLNFTMAVFATLLAISTGSRSGFPLAFEFRLPVRTAVLVAAPMLTLATLCASLYVLPMLVCRVLYGVAFPLLPAGMLIGTLVIILATCGWSANSTASRTFAIFGGIAIAMQLFGVLEPVALNARPLVAGQTPSFNPDILALMPHEYGVLAGVCLLLFAFAVASIRKQRWGENVTLALPASTLAKPPGTAFSLSALVERAPNLFTLPCPVTSPWRAELWLELKRQVTPVLLIGVLLALSVPLFFMLGIMPDHPALRSADYMLPAAVFFAGIGISVFNRRQVTAGYMSAFEGTRAMSTLRLAAIQVMSVAAGILLGIVIVCISVYFSSRLLDQPGNLALRLQALVSAQTELTPLYIVSQGITQLVTYVSAVMLLVCVHTWSVAWGRWVPYGASAIAIYGVILAVNVQTGRATLDDIRQHMWGFATAVCVLTLLAFGRTLYLKVLSLRAGVVALLCWAVFIACSLYSLAQQDIVLTRQAAALQVFNAALLVLPLLLFVLLLWSYDRLRHR